MSVTSSNIGPWVINGGSGITTVSYTQNVLNASDIGAYLTDGNGYQYPPLTNGVDFTVNGVNSYNSAAWTITYPAGTSLLTGWKFNAVLQIPYTQPYSLSALGGYDPSVVETKIADRLALQIQQLNAALYAASYPSTSAASAAGTSAAQAYVNTYGLQKANNLSDLASASTARTNLGLGTAATANTSAFDAAGTATTAVNAAVSGTIGQIATFTGTNAVGGAAQITYTASATVPVLQITGSTSAQLSTLVGTTQGGVFSYTGTGVFMGALSNDNLSIRTNNTDRLKFLAAGASYYAPVALTPGSTVAWDCSTGNYFTLTPAQAETINATNVQAGGIYTLAIKTSGTNSYTLTFGTNIKTGTSTLATGTVSAKYFIIIYQGTADGLVEISRTAAI